MNQELNWKQTGQNNEFVQRVMDYIDAQPMVDGEKDMSGFDKFMDNQGAIKIKSPDTIKYRGTTHEESNRKQRF